MADGQIIVPTPEEPPAPAAPARPDAVKFPTNFRGGLPPKEQVNAALYAERLLQVDYAAGERAYVRHQADFLYATRKGGDDPMFFPPSEGSSKGNVPRHDWKDAPNGVKLGYLTEDAKAAIEEAKP